VIDSHAHFLGFVDVLDIAGFILTNYGKKSEKFDDPHFVKDEFFQTEVRKLLNFSKIDNPIRVTEENTLEDLIKIFADPSRHHRLHRVAVMDKHANIINVVSQSDIIAMAAANIDTIPAEKRNATLDDLNVIHESVFTRIDDAFVDALDTLYQHKVSGIALVDNEARISANFSASDLRGMNEHSFRYFSGSALSFLVKGTDAKLGAPVSCVGATTFQEALQLLFNNRVHRLYAVTEMGQHIHGVVSISDLVPLLA
jgi:CBS-domain-containing membrane protein